MADDSLFHNLSDNPSPEALARLERRRAYSREKMRQRRAEFPERERERARKWRENNRERDAEIARQSRKRRKAADPAAWNAKIAARKRERYARDPEKHRKINNEKRRANLEKRRAYDRAKKLEYTYGITLEQRDAMLAAQGNACAICKATDTGKAKWWHVDHCHTTGKVRAILCHACNSALGYAKDSPEVLREMANYIERHRQ